MIYDGTALPGDESGEYTCSHCGKRQEWTLAKVVQWIGMSGIVPCEACGRSSYVYRRQGAWRRDGLRAEAKRGAGDSEDKPPNESEQFEPQAVGSVEVRGYVVTVWWRRDGESTPSVTACEFGDAMEIIGTALEQGLYVEARPL